MMSRSLGVLRIALAVTAVSAALPACAATSRDRGASIVVCALAHPIGQPIPALRTLWRIGDGRLLAPTRPAMFFSRKGDRCAWHARARLTG